MLDTQNQSPWLTPQQAAVYLRCSKNFLDRDRIEKLHGIPYSHLGRHIRYNRVDLDRFLESNKRQEAGK